MYQTQNEENTRILCQKTKREMILPIIIQEKQVNVLKIKHDYMYLEYISRHKIISNVRPLFTGELWFLLFIMNANSKLYIQLVYTSEYTDR